jgi:hypothetical protein
MQAQPKYQNHPLSFQPQLIFLKPERKFFPFKLKQGFYFGDFHTAKVRGKNLKGIFRMSILLEKVRLDMF